MTAERRSAMCDGRLVWVKAVQIGFFDGIVRYLTAFAIFFAARANVNLRCLRQRAILSTMAVTPE